MCTNNFFGTTLICVFGSRWKGVNRWYKPLDWVNIERKRQDKVVFDFVCV